MEDLKQQLEEWNERGHTGITKEFNKYRRIDQFVAQTVIKGILHKQKFVEFADAYNYRFAQMELVRNELASKSIPTRLVYALPDREKPFLELHEAMKLVEPFLVF